MVCMNTAWSQPICIWEDGSGGICIGYNFTHPCCRSVGMQHRAPNHKESWHRDAESEVSESYKHSVELDEFGGLLTSTVDRIYRCGINFDKPFVTTMLIYIAKLVTHVRGRKTCGVTTTVCSTAASVVHHTTRNDKATKQVSSYQKTRRVSHTHSSTFVLEKTLWILLKTKQHWDLCSSC